VRILPCRISVEYDPAADTITLQSSALPSARYGLDCALDSSTQKIHCFGGDEFSILSEIVEYTPSNDNVVIKSAVLPTGRYHLSCAEQSTSNKIYCFGGYDGNFLDEIIEYSLPLSFYWTDIKG